MKLAENGWRRRGGGVVFRVALFLRSCLPVLVLLLALCAPARAALPRWINISADAPWHVGLGLDCVVYRDQLWVVGEVANTGDGRHDLWRSADGYQWTRASELLPWQVPICRLVVFKDKLWAISANGATGGIWNSENGTSWTLAANSPARDAQPNAAIVFNNKLWLIDTAELEPGIWNSDDGIHWTRMATSVPFLHELKGFATVVFNGKLWLLGGTSRYTPGGSEIWNSTNGITWTKVVGATAWSRRGGHSVVAYGNKLWLTSGYNYNSSIGGFDSTQAEDIWTSVDGVQWIKETAGTPSAGRYWNTVVVFKSVIWYLNSLFSRPSETWTLGYLPGAPVPQSWPEQSCLEYVRYTSPVPALRQASLPFTWTLLSGPAGMTVNARSGAVTWPAPIGRTQPYAIRMRVSNAHGSAELAWNLKVNPQPATVVGMAVYAREPMVPVNWITLPYVSGYTIQSDDAPDFATPLLTVNAGSRETRAFMPAPPAGKTWWYRVRGNKPAPLTSLWSKPVACTRDISAPTGSMSMAQTPEPVANAVLLNLSIQDPGTQAAGLHVMRFSYDGVNWTPWEPCQSFKLLPVDRGGALGIRVQVVDRVWNVLNLQTTATIPAPAPDTLFVDASNAGSPGLGTFAHPYGRIQPALDAAAAGGTVIVAPGTYAENIDFKGKDLVLRSRVPQLQTVVRTTVIDGRSSGSVVRFRGTESAACRLEGFTITHGLSEYGGGINGDWTHATIQYNRIVDNRACYTYQIITGQPPFWADITTYAYGYGGGLAHCSGLIQNNIIAFNEATGGTRFTGASRVSTEQNIRSFYTQEFKGGALYGCGGTIQNNTIYANMTGGSGSGTSVTPPSAWYPSLTGAGTLRGNIIWMTDLDPDLAATTSYCCISGWSGGGVKNITSDPILANPLAGDFRLLATSPCIDAGCRTSATRDIDGEARGYNGSAQARGDGSDFDIGADEYVPTTAAR